MAAYVAAESSRTVQLFASHDGEHDGWTLVATWTIDAPWGYTTRRWPVVETALAARFWKVSITETHNGVAPQLHFCKLIKCVANPAAEMDELSERDDHKSTSTAAGPANEVEGGVGVRAGAAPDAASGGEAANDPESRKLAVGDRVMALFKGHSSLKYPGQIVCDHGDGTFDIVYDDGPKEQRVRQELIEDCDVPRLVALVKDGAPGARQEAALMLKRLASIVSNNNAANKEAIAAAGGITALVELTKDGSPGARAQAAGALANLAGITMSDSTIVDSRYEEAIVAAGGIAPLVEIIKNGTPDGRNEAADALRILSKRPVINEAIATAGGIAPLVELAKNGSMPKQANEHAANALWNLSKNAVIKEAIEAAGHHL